MKYLVAALILLSCCVSLASANAFSAWSASGDAWTATNDTTTAWMWNATGAHTWIASGNASTLNEVDAVGGGAGGGGSHLSTGAGGGGGGAGGVAVNLTFPVSGSISITVGVGGVGGTDSTNGTAGGDSVFGTVTGKGGGGGGAGTSKFGSPGGSGGGGGYSGKAGGAALQPTSPYWGYGSAGRTGQGASGNYSGGDGGGAGGQSTSSDKGLCGLPYTINWIGSTVAYGGGGGIYYPAWFGCVDGIAPFGNTSKNATTYGSGGAGTYAAVSSSIGGNGYKGVVIISYPTGGGGTPISASFTQSSNPSSTGQAVTYTDTSTGTPVTWNWTLAGTSPTNTTQPAAYTYSTFGVYNIFLNVTNATGAWSNTSQTHTVVNASGFTPQDVWMQGQYIQTFHIIDSNALPIAVVTCTDSGGQSFTSTNGTCYLTEPFGVSVVTFVSSGYNAKAVSYVFDSDASWTVQLVTASPAPSTPSIVYIPQQVRIKLVGLDSYPLSGVTISATPQNFTAPDNWTQTLFGISPGVNIRNTTVYGDTGSDGSWVAPMLQSFQYNITMERTPDVNYAITIYPSQTEYTFMIPLGYVAIPTPAGNIITYSLQNASIDSAHQYINMSYSDTSTAGTNMLNFSVYNLTGALVASANYSGTSACSQTFSQIITVSQGQSYTYGMTANQSQYGWINQTSTLTLENQIALIGSAPSWVEEWIAIGLIILFAAGFSIWSKPIAMMVIPILTWYFQFVMGWLPSSFMSSITLGVMLAIGVLIYIRQKENTIQ